MKEKLGLHNNRMLSIKDTYTKVGRQKNFKSAAEIAQRSITLVADKNNLLPLQPDVDEVIYLIDLYDGANNHTESDLTKQLKRAGRKAKSFQIDKSDSLVVADYILDQSVIMDPKNFDARALRILFNSKVPSVFSNKSELKEDLYVFNQLNKNLSKTSIYNEWIISIINEVQTNPAP